MSDDAGLRRQVKDEIRRRRRSLRAALPKEAREQRSVALCERLVALDEWVAAKSVLAFVSMRTEVQTQVAVDAAWAAGKLVAAPRMNESRDDLVLAEWRAADELEPSGMRFLQPPPHAPRVEEPTIDLVIVPALAVDPRGHRVGYGAGFYDRLLPRLTRAVRVAVVFDFERIAEVPERPEDEVVHIIVTDACVSRPE